MALFRGNQELSSQQVESIALRIKEEYDVTNVTFLEQTEHYCKFIGYKDNRQYYYSFDKGSTFGFIIEAEEE